MKKLLLLFTGFAALTANAQDHIIETENVTAEVITRQGDEFNVKADKMSHNNSAQTIEYTGVISLTTEMIEICDADKVVYNIETNELILTGNLSMTGVTLHMETPYKGKSRQIRYKIGDTVAYME